MKPINTSDKSNPLILTVNNCVFSDNTPWVSGFFSLYENSILYITDASFTNMYSVGSGSVIVANSKDNQIVINTSSFSNNYAILGGVFYSQYNSFITWNQWVFTNNFAIRGGIAFLDNNGRISLNTCTISSNQALNGPILFITDSSSTYSMISNSTIYGNNVILMSDLLIKNGTGLSQISDLYINFIKSNQSIYEKSISGSKKAGISIFNGRIKISDGTIVRSQPDILAAFESEIAITSSIIKDVSINIGHIAFYLTSSILTFTNSTISNVTCPSSTEAIFQARLESTLTISGSLSKISSSTCEFGRLLSSFASIGDITFDSNSLTTPLFESVESSVSFTGITLKNINTTATTIISVENAASLTTNSSNFLSANKQYFYVTGSTATFQNTIFDNQMGIQMKAVYFEDTTATLLQSTFKNLKYTDQGGAVDTLNSNIVVNGSTFMNNFCPIAGAIALRWEIGSVWTYSIVNSIFTNNSATTNGGAIMYDFFKPTLSGNVFTNNSARYGPNIAGYPVKVVAQDVPSQVWASGLTIATPIKYKLVDADGLTITTDSDSVITISSQSSSDKVIGNSDVTVVNGTATFSDVALISSPNGKNINYTISSLNIDLTKLATAFGLTVSNSTQTLSVNFRDCAKGEQKINGIWTTWPAGKYSLTIGSTDCHDCPKHATCPGGAVIWVDEGYWRSSFDSDNIQEWISTSSCLKYEGTPADVPYNCKTGYSSTLWDSWASVNGTKYQRAGDHKCESCPETILNIFRILGLLVLIVVVIIIIVWSNIKSVDESSTPILIRIMINYFQIVGLAASFSLTFPSNLQIYLYCFNFYIIVKHSIIKIICCLFFNL